MRTLTFDQISDSRFSGTKAKLADITTRVKKALSKLEGVKVGVSQVRALTFTDKEEPSSWRQTFYVQKSGRGTTWNDIYRAVNDVKAVHYSFVNVIDIDDMAK